MLTSVQTHGQSRRSNAGAKTSQLTSHTDVLTKVRNASVTVDGLSMEPRLEPTRKHLISSEPSSFQWLFPELTERELSNAMPLPSTVLIQPQMLTKHASVINRRNSLTNLSLLPPELSGNHLKLSLNLNPSSREPLNTQVRSKKSPRKRKEPPRNLQLPLVLRTTKPLLISKPPRLVPFNQLKKPTSSERQRLSQKDKLALRPSPRREPLLTLTNSNLMLRRPQHK